MNSASSRRTDDELFDELIASLERDADFDVDTFLWHHPDQAAWLRASLSHLQEIGLAPRPINKNPRQSSEK